MRTSLVIIGKVHDLVENAYEVAGTGFGHGVSSAKGYDQFENVDRLRKGLLHTQACDGTWRLLLSFAPSVLPYVLLSMDFWLSVFIYVTGRLLLIGGYFEPVDLGSFRGLGIMGLVLALMLNFYVNISVTRMFETNKDAMELIRGVNDLALALRGYLWDTPEQQDIARRCVDYMCAAHVFAYTGFTEEYTTENLWTGFNEEFGVLTTKEDDYISRHREKGGTRMKECTAWVMRELHRAVKKGFLPPPVASGFNKLVNNFNDHVQSLFDFRYMPIPFVSEHLLVFLLHIYLPIQTFEMAVQTELLKQRSKNMTALMIIEVIGCLLAILANMGFQGLFTVGAILEQPYGHRINHSRVSSFCRIAAQNARKTLSSGSPRNKLAPLEDAKLKDDLIAKLSSHHIKVSKKLGVRVLEELVSICPKEGEQIEVPIVDTDWQGLEVTKPSKPPMFPVVAAGT